MSRDTMDWVNVSEPMLCGLGCGVRIQRGWLHRHRHDLGLICEACSKFDCIICGRECEGLPWMCSGCQGEHCDSCRGVIRPTCLPLPPPGGPRFQPWDLDVWIARLLVQGWQVQVEMSAAGFAVTLIRATGGEKGVYLAPTLRAALAEALERKDNPFTKKKSA